MQFETKVLSSTIAPYVEAIFHYQNFYPDHSVERVVPTGHHHVIFELDDIVRHTFDPDTLQPSADFRQAWVSAIRQDHLSISAHQNSEMLVIQFKPYGAFPVFHHSMAQLSDRVVVGADVLGGELLALRAEIYQAETPIDKLQLAEDWVIARLKLELAAPPGLVELIETLFREPESRLSDVAAHYPASQKHFIDQFKKYVGVTPKVLQRIIRFNQILQQIQAEKPLVWSDIASLCGYADQSHFIREFRKFSGFNPGEFLQLGFDGQEPNFFPMDSASENE